MFLTISLIKLHIYEHQVVWARLFLNNLITSLCMKNVRDNTANALLLFNWMLLNSNDITHYKQW